MEHAHTIAFWVFTVVLALVVLNLICYVILWIIKPRTEKHFPSVASRRRAEPSFSESPPSLRRKQRQFDAPARHPVSFDAPPSHFDDAEIDDGPSDALPKKPQPRDALPCSPRESPSFPELPDEDTQHDELSAEDLYDIALKLVLESRKASVSFLQRRLRIGSALAGLMMDMMEARGIVGPNLGMRPREVLVDSVTENPSAENQDKTEPAVDPRVLAPVDAVDKVHFTVTSPPMVARGSSFVVNVWGHLDRQREEVIRRARESAIDSRILVNAKGPVNIARGAVLVVRLQIEGLTIPDPEDTMLWEGEIGNACFGVLVPKDLSEGPRLGLATIHLNGMRIARVYFNVCLDCLPGEDPPPMQEERHQKAFVSYANPDRDEVLARIQGMLKMNPGMDIFLDVISLRSGQLWEKELWRVIPKNDVFYLFWSGHARTSDWVEKEWRCALHTRGLDFIDPVPLVSPEKVPPPPELAGKHFNDRLLAYMRPGNFEN